MREGLTSRELNSEVSKAYDAIATSYDSFYSEPVYQTEDRILYLDLLQHFIDQGTGQIKSIVDVGCGTGNAWDYIGSWLSSHDYYGVDVSRGMIDKAIEKVGRSPTTSFRVQDIREHTKIHDVLISMYGGFSYMPVDEVAQQISGLLRRRGRFYVVLFGQGYIPSDNVVVDESSAMVRTDCSEIKSVFSKPSYGLAVTGIEALLTEVSKNQSKSKRVSLIRQEKNRGQFLVVKGFRV